MTATDIWQTGIDIANRLGDGELFTDIAAELTGEAIVADVISRENGRPMDQAEHDQLETSRDDSRQCYRRFGWLRTVSGRRVAMIESLFLPLRIPDHRIRRQLWMTDIPLGCALRPAGIRRDLLDAETIGRGSFALRTSGLLLLPGDGAGLPVAIAREWVLRAWVATLPRRHALA